MNSSFFALALLVALAAASPLPQHQNAVENVVDNAKLFIAGVNDGLFHFGSDFDILGCAYDLQDTWIFGQSFFALILDTISKNGFDFNALLQAVYSQIPDTLKVMEKLQGTCGPISEDFVSVYGLVTILFKRSALWGYIKLLALNPLNWPKTVQESLGTLYHLSQNEFQEAGDDFGTLLKRLLSNTIIYKMLE